jgi:hypothetical protein
VGPKASGDIAPDDVLGPGKRDARRLLVLWLIRRSAVPVFWLGLMIGVLVSPGHYVEASFDSPVDAFGQLLSPAAGIALALLLRVGTTTAGFALALPLARGFIGAGGVPAGYSGGGLSRVFDGFGASRGYGALRFTRTVRDAAAARLGQEGARHDRLDRWVTRANLALPALTLLVIAVG